MHDISYSTNEGQPLLQHFTLTIPSGQIVSLVGDVHEGGDTVLAILSGICTTYEGQVFHNGTLSNPKLLAEMVAVSPAEHFLIDTMSVKANVKLFLSIRHTMGKDAFLISSKFSYSTEMSVLF